MEVARQPGPRASAAVLPGRAEDPAELCPSLAGAGRHLPRSGGIAAGYAVLQGGVNV